MPFEIIRELIPSTAFTNAARKYLILHPQSADRIQETLENRENDAFAPHLRTHKLKGELTGVWACSVGYDLRIVFEFVNRENGEAILLLTVGNHDSVY